jgi:hypothetical protein
MEHVCQRQPTYAKGSRSEKVPAGYAIAVPPWFAKDRQHDRLFAGSGGGRLPDLL